MRVDGSKTAVGESGAIVGFCVLGWGGLEGRHDHDACLKCEWTQELVVDGSKEVLT